MTNKYSHWLFEFAACAAYRTGVGDLKPLFDAIRVEGMLDVGFVRFTLELGDRLSFQETIPADGAYGDARHLIVFDVFRQ